jgi:hypothetical protein
MGIQIRFSNTVLYNSQFLYANAFLAFRSLDDKDMRRSVTTRARDSSMLLITPGLQHVLSYRYHDTSGYSTSSHTGTTTPRATARPLIQVSRHLGLQHVLSYRYHHTSGYRMSTSSTTGTTTPWATARPLIQVPPHLGLQHILSYRYHHTLGYSTSSHTGTNTPRATTHPLIQVQF